MVRPLNDGTGRLPTFLVIGAMRSGTTSVSVALAEHPEVFMPPGKELHFFDEHFDRGVDWYRARFADAAEPCVGEGTPRYMYDPRAVARMADVVPDARLVAILRNPLDRAYSHWQHELTRGREDLGFAEAIEAEPDRLAAMDPLRASHFAYLDRGRYLGQLRTVCDLYPRSSLHVMLFEEFRTGPEERFRSLCRFLGVDQGYRPTSLDRTWNPSYRVRWRSVHRLAERSPGPLRRVLHRLNVRRMAATAPMDPELRRRLVDRFADENAELAAWLGRDLSVWEAP